MGFLFLKTLILASGIGYIWHNLEELHKEILNSIKN